MQKLLVKAAALISNEGQPRFYIRSLVTLNDGLQDTTTAKKMNPSTAKAFNAMKQKVKKTIKTYEDDVALFTANPIDEEASADEAEAIAMNEEDIVPTGPKKVIFVDEDIDAGEFTVVGKGSKPIEKITSLSLFDKLEEILQARGKKSTDKGLQIEQLAKLYEQTFTPYQKIKCLMSLLSARFDYVPAASGIMNTEMWTSALNEIKSLHDLLDANKHITVGNVQIDESVSELVRDRETTDGTPVVIPGIITSFVDRLDDEFNKSLQALDGHSSDYIDRLRDEMTLYAMLVRSGAYAEEIGTIQDALDLMTMRRVEHLYYKVNLL